MVGRDAVPGGQEDRLGRAAAHHLERVPPEGARLERHQPLRVEPRGRRVSRVDNTGCPSRSRILVGMTSIFAVPPSLPISAWAVGKLASGQDGETS